MNNHNKRKETRISCQDKPLSAIRTIKRASENKGNRHQGLMLRIGTCKTQPTSDDGDELIISEISNLLTYLQTNTVRKLSKNHDLGCINIPLLDKCLRCQRKIALEKLNDIEADAKTMHRNERATPPSGKNVCNKTKPDAHFERNMVTRQNNAFTAIRERFLSCDEKLQVNLKYNISSIFLKPDTGKLQQKEKEKNTEAISCQTPCAKLKKNCNPSLKYENKKSCTCSIDKSPVRYIKNFAPSCETHMVMDNVRKGETRASKALNKLLDDNNSPQRNEELKYSAQKRVDPPAVADTREERNINNVQKVLRTGGNCGCKSKSLRLTCFKPFKCKSLWNSEDAKEEPLVEKKYVQKAFKTRKTGSNFNKSDRIFCEMFPTPPKKYNAKCETESKSNKAERNIKMQHVQTENILHSECNNKCQKKDKRIGSTKKSNGLTDKNIMAKLSSHKSEDCHGRFLKMIIPNSPMLSYKKDKSLVKIELSRYLYPVQHSGCDKSLEYFTNITLGIIKVPSMCQLNYFNNVLEVPINKMCSSNVSQKDKYTLLYNKSQALDNRLDYIINECERNDRLPTASNSDGDLESNNRITAVCSIGNYSRHMLQSLVHPKETNLTSVKTSFDEDATESRKSDASNLVRIRSVSCRAFVKSKNLISTKEFRSLTTVKKSDKAYFSNITSLLSNYKRQSFSIDLTHALNIKQAVRSISSSCYNMKNYSAENVNLHNHFNTNKNIIHAQSRYSKTTTAKFFYNARSESCFCCLLAPHTGICTKCCSNYVDKHIRFKCPEESSVRDFNKETQNCLGCNEQQCKHTCCIKDYKDTLNYNFEDAQKSSYDSFDSYILKEKISSDIQNNNKYPNGAPSTKENIRYSDDQDDQFETPRLKKAIVKKDTNKHDKRRNNSKHFKKSSLKRDSIQNRNLASISQQCIKQFTDKTQYKPQLKKRRLIQGSRRSLNAKNYSPMLCKMFKKVFGLVDTSGPSRPPRPIGFRNNLKNQSSCNAGKSINFCRFKCGAQNVKKCELTFSDFKQLTDKQLKSLISRLQPEVSGDFKNNKGKRQIFPLKNDDFLTEEEEMSFYCDYAEEMCESDMYGPDSPESDGFTAEDCETIQGINFYIRPNSLRLNKSRNFLRWIT